MENREIKFRAWHKGQKKMYSAKEMGQDELTINPDGRGLVNVSGESTTLSQYAGEKMILMQFTGLKDKNGKEIWEGDVVEEGGSHFENLLVSYEPDIIAGFILREVDTVIKLGKPKKDYIKNWFPLHNRWNIEVIGNIYENPELLK